MNNSKKSINLSRDSQLVPEIDIGESEKFDDLKQFLKSQSSLEKNKKFALKLHDKKLSNQNLDIIKKEYQDKLYKYVQTDTEFEPINAQYAKKYNFPDKHYSPSLDENVQDVGSNKHEN